MRAAVAVGAGLLSEGRHCSLRILVVVLRHVVVGEEALFGREGRRAAAWGAREDAIPPFVPFAACKLQRRDAREWHLVMATSLLSRRILERGKEAGISGDEACPVSTMTAIIQVIVL